MCSVLLQRVFGSRSKQQLDGARVEEMGTVPSKSGPRAQAWRAILACWTPR